MMRRGERTIAQPWRALLATLVAALSVPVTGAAATDEMRLFSPVGATNGLDARVIVSMLFDRQGYLWVGAREGLYRYDGDETRAFLPDPGNPGSISDVDIRYVYEADDGAIWVGTNTGGLNRFDAATGRFTVYRADSGDPGSLPDDTVYGISQGPDGHVWVATQRGLGRLDSATSRFELFRHDPDDPSTLAHDWAFTLHRGPTGTLWIGTRGGGVHRWNPETRSFTRFDLARLTQGPVKRNNVFRIHEHADGRLWLGTEAGIVVLDPNRASARPFETITRDGGDPTITSLSVDSLGRFWLGTVYEGVIVVDPEEETWSRASTAALGEQGSLPAQAVGSLATNGEQMFVGTFGNGVYRTPIAAPPFRFLRGRDADGPLRNPNVTSVLGTDAPGRPWLGSFGDGPQQVDVIMAENLSVEQPADPITASYVLDLAVDAEGRYFAATDAGLFEFDGAGRALLVEAHDPKTPGGIGAGYVSALLPTRDGDLWVGVMGSGLFLRDGETGRYTPYRHDPDDPASLSGDFVTALAAGGDDGLWVGTRSNGLNRCRPDPWRCERFDGRNPGVGELSHFHVTALRRDRRGHLWVGTDGGGLNRVLGGQDGAIRFEYWTREQGLLDNGIMSIEEDVDESLWLGTRHGLSRFKPSTGQSVNYVSGSGLPVSHFNTNASGSDDDWLYFGSVEGLLAFPKGGLLEERAPAPVRITRIRVTDRGKRPSDLDPDAERLVVPYGDVVTLQVTVLDYSEGTHEYAYRMGPDEPWIELGRQRQVIFHGLTPGEYRFQARGRDSSGLWGESGTLVLEIDPPFWMTSLFRGLLAAALVLIAWGLHALRLERQRRQAEQIQRLSSKREEALEEALGSEAELKVLTPRQKEVLQLIAEGFATKEIADLLDVSVKTVEAHRTNLMDRLDIRDVPGLVRLAIRARLVSPHE